MMSLSRLSTIVISVSIMSLPAFLVFQEAYAIDDCYTRFIFAWHTLNPVLDCIETRLDSGGGGGEANTASNLGDGDGVFAQKVGVDLQFKSLENGTGISLSSDANEVTITSTVVDTNNCTSTGTGEAVCESANNINSLIGGNDITITDTTGDLTIASTATEESTVCSNTGTGNGLCNGGNVNIKSLIAGSGITIQDTTDDYTISSSGGSNALLDGSVHTDTTNSSATAGDLIVVNDTGLWDDLPLGDDDLFLRSDSSETLNVRWSTIARNDIPDLETLIYSVYQSKTMTNIGTSFVDIYTTAFDEENQYKLPNGACQIGAISIYLLWDYVGTGTQTIRWVDASNNNNVLASIDVTSDQDPSTVITGTIGSWCLSTWNTIEVQAKSTTAGDDPVMRGYSLYAYN